MPTGQDEIGDFPARVCDRRSHSLLAVTEEQDGSILQRHARMARGRLLFVVNDTTFFVSHRLPLAIAARKAGFEIDLAALDFRAASRKSERTVSHSTH